jgi:hypothetical protein
MYLQVNVIGVLDSLGHLLGLVGSESDLLAHGTTLFILHHANDEARVDDAIAAQNLAQVLRLVLDAADGLAVQRHVVVLVRQLGLGARQLDSLFIWN